MIRSSIDSLRSVRIAVELGALGPESEADPEHRVRGSESPEGSTPMKHPVSQSTSEFRIGEPKKNAGEFLDLPIPSIVIEIEIQPDDRRCD